VCLTHLPLYPAPMCYVRKVISASNPRRVRNVFRMHNLQIPRRGLTMRARLIMILFVRTKMVLNAHLVIAAKPTGRIIRYWDTENAELFPRHRQLTRGCVPRFTDPFVGSRGLAKGHLEMPTKPAVIIILSFTKGAADKFLFTLG